MKRLLEEVGEGNRPSSKRGWKEQDKQGEINIIDFDNDDEYAPDAGPSQKATKSKDVGVQVHFLDDRIQEQLMVYWVVKGNLKGFFLLHFGRNFDDPMDKIILRCLLVALRKLAMTVWKSNVCQDFENRVTCRRRNGHLSLSSVMMGVAQGTVSLLLEVPRRLPRHKTNRSSALIYVFPTTEQKNVSTLLEQSN